MNKRTTIEIDQELLAEAKRALGQTTIRATVEEALRRATEVADREFKERRARQLRFLEEMDKYLDLDMLASDEMWR